MIDMHAALLLWFCVMASGSDVTPCPTHCLCVINDHYAQTLDIECHDRPSENIRLAPQVTSLAYYNVSTQNNNPNLIPTALDGSELLKLVVKRSKLECVEPLTFNKLTKLEYLDLGENSLIEISQSILQPLYLYCTHLKHLDLSFNRVTHIQENSTLSSSLTVLLLNNNKIKEIPKHLFEKLINLKTLSLANNNIHYVPYDIFPRLNALEKLDLQSNEIVNFPGGSFEGLVKLTVLNISKNPFSELNEKLFQNNVNMHVLDARDTYIYRIRGNLLSKLKRLQVLNMSHNNHLTTIDDFKFSSSNHLQYIDLRFANLTTVPKFLLYLDVVEELSLDGNPWQCTCTSIWFSHWLANHRHLVNNSLVCDGSDNMIDTLNRLVCEAPSATNTTLSQVMELRSNVILTCTFKGNPEPSLTWLTPSGYVLHYNPSNSSGDAYSNHPRIHLYNLEPTSTTHIKLLNNGSLEIKELLRQDAGSYRCIAINSVGNATSQIIVTLDRKTFYHIKLMCIIVGASCVAAVLLCTALGQIIYWTCRK